MGAISLPPNFWDKVESAPGEACWTWRAATTVDGYGQVRHNGPTRRAHRLTYEHFIAEIPPGLTLDHLCRNRACVNPWHLEAVPQRVNALRGFGACAEHARQTACRNGHDFTPESTRIDRFGHRICKPCQARSQARYARRQRVVASER